MLVVLTSGAFYLNDQSYDHLQVLKKDLLSEKQEYEKLSQEVKELKQLVYDLNHDPVVIEKYARDQYGLARPDEKIIFLDSKSK